LPPESTDSLTSKPPVKNLSKYVHVLDPGHGGVDDDGVYTTGGKRSGIWPDGTQYFEGQGNREIAAILGKMLTEVKIDHCYTVDPSNPTDLSLSRRVKIANEEEEKRDSILWAIHSNGYKKESAHGYEVFTSPGQTLSDPIADILIEEMGKEFPELKRRSDDSDGDLDKEAKFAVLIQTNGRSVLLESMFHTNLIECKILMSRRGKERVAKVLFNAIIRVESI